MTLEDFRRNQQRAGRSASEGKGAHPRQDPGDLLVTVEVEVPAELSEGARGRRKHCGLRGVHDPRAEVDSKGWRCVMASQLDDDQPVYVISVASELSGLHPQNAAAVYEQLGLVSPDRAGT